LHASAHHSALDLRAFNQWRRLTEARHQQIRRKLEQVAQWRLSLLLSGADERMAKVRQLARRMLKKLEYMVFMAWREWYEESVVFERRARACYARVSGRRCWRKWSPLVQQGRAARDRFEKAARMKRRIGLAKVYRSWRAATERGHVEEKAARAERAMLQLALARAFHGWLANIDTEAEQNAAKANRAMRTLGLAHALRQWRAQTDPHAKMVMAKAVRAMRQLSLAK